jgi:hypothetical protein
MFRRVFAAAVDTLYVVCFFVEDEDALLRGRARIASPPPSPP